MKEKGRVSISEIKGILSENEDIDPAESKETIRPDAGHIYFRDERTLDDLIAISSARSGIEGTK